MFRKYQSNKELRQLEGKIFHETHRNPLIKTYDMFDITRSPDLDKTDFFMDFQMTATITNPKPDLHKYQFVPKR